MSESHTNLAVRQAIVAGAAAGNVTVAGITTNDVIKSVTYVNFALTEGTPNTKAWTVADRTSEFTITADNTINNTSGTSSAGGLLFVLYLKAGKGAPKGGLSRGNL